MTVTAAFFYLFSGIMLASAFMVIAARNPVHSVLFLILAFVNAAGLFLLMGAEFLAMILVVVYVDSGSTDGSVELAHGVGAKVIELDTSIAFTAARARNAGFDRRKTPDRRAHSRPGPDRRIVAAAR